MLRTLRREGAIDVEEALFQRPSGPIWTFNGLKDENNLTVDGRITPHVHWHDDGPYLEPLPIYKQVQPLGRALTLAQGPAQLRSSGSGSPSRPGDRARPVGPDLRPRHTRRVRATTLTPLLLPLAHLAHFSLVREKCRGGREEPCRICLLGNAARARPFPISCRGSFVAYYDRRTAIGPCEGGRGKTCGGYPWVPLPLPGLRNASRHNSACVVQGGRLIMIP